MSTYLGNPSLSAAVKDRVITTFEQSISLYKQGRIDEVVAGCGLILQMDPQFDPAKRLLEKARNPMLPIDIDSLVPAASADDAMREAREAMRGRDFQRVINITTEILTNDLMNDDARILGDEAREKMEAAPFVDQFARKFDQNLANSDLVSARANLEKARSLDRDHPAIRQMESQLASRQPSTAPAPAAPPQPQAPPSFVVDNPSPAVPGRGTAQAADFGFTFEEEKPAAPAGGGFAGFSFDSPASSDTPSFSFDTPAQSGGAEPESPTSPPAASGSFSFGKTPATGEFDFGAASFETSPEDRKKIEQYLADGDRAYSAGDYQKAIDLWSRIFLIDVTNEQASERIERAKTARREIETKADGMIAAATQAYDQSDFDRARAQFNEILHVDPSNATAHDYLARIAKATAAAGGPAAAPAAALPVPTSPKEEFDLFADDDVSGSYVPSMPASTPPATAAAKKKETAPKPAGSGKGLPLGVIATVVAIIVLAAGGWFAYSKFFAKPAFDPAATKRIFTEATSLAQKGSYDAAIQMLQEVKQEDPQHDRAVLMIADMQHKKSQAAEMIGGRPAAQFFNDQLAKGQAAYAAHDFDGAKKAFEQAMRAKPLPPDLKALYDNASEQVAKLDSAKSLFHERRFQDALATLQPLQQQDPENKNIQRMIIDAHFNLGATALQEERLPDAINEFDQVLKLDPTDDLAKRSKELANRYNGQPKDLLFKIYVKYLSLRQVA